VTIWWFLLGGDLLAQIFHEALWVPGVVGDLGEVGVVGLVRLWRGTRMCDPVYGHAVLSCPKANSIKGGEVSGEPAGSGGEWEGL
jgi:hypothetical protein